MRSFWKYVFLTTLLTVRFAAAQNIQNMQWGTGMYGASQNCNSQQKAGNGNIIVSDEMKELAESYKESTKDLSDQKRQKKSVDKELEKLRRDLEASLEPSVLEFSLAHMENKHRCEDYQTGDGKDKNKLPISGISKEDFPTYCNANKPGALMASLCDDVHYRVIEKNGRSNSNVCKKSLADYRTKYADSQKIASDIEDTQSKINQYKDDVKEARKEASENRSASGSEGGICIDCMANGNGYITQQRSTDWTGVATNVGSVLASGGMGSGTTGQGSFGCGGITAGLANGGNSYGYGNMVGGAMGYPASMYASPMSGGMYSSNGMSPWGIAGSNSMMNTGAMTNYGMAVGGYGTMNGYGTMTTGYGTMTSNPNIPISANAFGASYNNAFGMGYGSSYTNYGQQQGTYNALLLRLQQMQSGYGNIGYYGNSYTSNPSIPIPASTLGTSTTYPSVIPATYSSGLLYNR